MHNTFSKIVFILGLARRASLSRLLISTFFALSASLFQLLYIYYSAQFAKSIASESADRFSLALISIFWISISGLVASAFYWLTLFTGKHACREISTDICNSFYISYIESSPFKLNSLEPTEEISTLTVQLNQFAVGVIYQITPLLLALLNSLFISIAIIIELNLIGVGLIFALGLLVSAYTAKNKKRITAISRIFRKLTISELRLATDAILSRPQLEDPRLASQLSDEYSKIIYSLRDSQALSRYILLASKPLIESVVYIGLLAYVFFIFQYNTSQLAVTQLMVFLVVLVSAFQRAIPALNILSTAVNSVRTSGSSINKLYSTKKYLDKNKLSSLHVFDLKPKSPLTTKLNYPFTVKALKFKLGSRIISCSYLSFKPNSRIMALVGPSGIGKSSVLKTLFGLNEIESGSLTISSEYVTNMFNKTLHSPGYDLKCFDERFGLVSAFAMQDTYLFEERSVLFNITFETDKDLVEAELLAEALYCSCLDPSESNNIGKDFLDIIVKSSGTVLSGGQRKRIGIARAIYANKPIITLDEPTAGLNHDLEIQLSNRLLELSRKKYLIISSHSKCITDLADTIYSMKQANNSPNIYVTRDGTGEQSVIQPHMI